MCAKCTILHTRHIQRMPSSWKFGRATDTNDIIIKSYIMAQRWLRWICSVLFLFLPCAWCPDAIIPQTMAHSFFVCRSHNSIENLIKYIINYHFQLIIVFAQIESFTAFVAAFFLVFPWNRAKHFFLRSHLRKISYKVRPQSRGKNVLSERPANFVR